MTLWAINGRRNERWARKERRNWDRHSGMISRQERVGGKGVGRHSGMLTGQEREVEKGVDTLGWSPGKKGRKKTGRKHSGMISRQEREGGTGVDPLGRSAGKKGKEESAYTL